MPDVNNILRDASCPSRARRLHSEVPMARLNSPIFTAYFKVRMNPSEVSGTGEGGIAEITHRRVRFHSASSFCLQPLQIRELRVLCHDEGSANGFAGMARGISRQFDPARTSRSVDVEIFSAGRE